MGAQMIKTGFPKAMPAGLPSAKPPSYSVIAALSAEDQVLLTKLLTEPSDFVDHPDFGKPSTERTLFGACARLTNRAATRFEELGDTITYPGWPVKWTELSPYKPQRRAPLIGEHNQEVYEKEMGLSPEQVVQLKSKEVLRSRSQKMAKQIFEGIKVADFSWVGVGPQVARELAEHFVDVDERTPVDRLLLAQKFAQLVRYYRDEVAAAEGDWQSFFRYDAQAAARLVADQSGQTRAHLALFIAFLKLYEFPREAVNRFTLRHLDFFYRRVLGFSARGPVADRAHVVVELRKKAPPVALLPEHMLSGGKDAMGVERLYAPVRKTILSGAEIASLRSVGCINAMLVTSRTPRGYAWKQLVSVSEVTSMKCSTTREGSTIPPSPSIASSTLTRVSGGR